MGKINMTKAWKHYLQLPPHAVGRDTAVYLKQALDTIDEMRDETEPSEVSSAGLLCLSTKNLKNIIGGAYIEGSPDSDNLAIALCTYFDRHLDRPEDDPEGEHGWGEWVARKCDEALKRIIEELERHNVKVSYHADNAGGARGKDTNGK